MGAEDLIGSVFPDQIACAENLAGEREIPDHPLVQQAIGDCLTEAMDLAGLERLLKGIEFGAIQVIARDLRNPRRSPSKCCRRAPMPISTTRRSRNAAPRR